jgi:isopenicillin N synthase-like dioxygenase
MHDLGLKILSHLSIGLGKKKDYFDPWFKEACGSTFRSIHYLPRSHKDAANCSKLDPNL